jgi:hypothetical protein
MTNDGLAHGPVLVPQACTLPTAEQPVRLAEFDDLFANAVRGIETLGRTRSRMRLSGPAGLAARVRDLTARETECCSFFTFTVTSEPAADGETVVLDIEVPAEYADVLGALTQRAVAATTVRLARAEVAETIAVPTTREAV